MTATARPARPIRTAIVGLGFGAEFIPIHQRHPHVELVAICQRSRDKLDQVGKAYGVERRYQDYADLLKDNQIDAVHINSPIPDHATMTLAALEAGKHVMCTVPMATSVEDCKRIVDLTAKTGLKYMMAETVVYAREFLFIKQLADRGDLGKIQFVQASHQQDMDGWPNYWPGLPPMHYATHCVGPCLALERKDAAEVSCFGSGRIREELVGKYGSPFAIETAHVAFIMYMYYLFYNPGCDLRKLLLLNALYAGVVFLMTIFKRCVVNVLADRVTGVTQPHLSPFRVFGFLFGPDAPVPDQRAAGDVDDAMRCRLSRRWMDAQRVPAAVLVLLNAWCLFRLGRAGALGRRGSR